MKTLFILRHAKAEQASDGQLDFDRALTGQGRRDARHVGERLLERKLTPDLILASAALRARETAEIVADALTHAGPLMLHRGLYMASPQTYVRLLHEEGRERDSAMLVGHNPTLDELLFRLTAADESFPTAGLARIECELDSWDELALAQCYRLVDFWRPKEWED